MSELIRLTKSLFPLLVFFGLILFGCASASRSNSQPSPQSDPVLSSRVESEARPIYSQAERAYESKNFSEARKLFSTVRAKYPRGRAAMMSSYRLGTILYYQEDYDSAAREFDSFLVNYSGSELAFDVTYNLAACEFQLKQFEKAYLALSRLKRSDIQAQGTRRAEVILQLTAQVAAETNRPAAWVVANALLIPLQTDEGRRLRLLTDSDRALSKMSHRGELEALLAETSEPLTRTRIQQRLATVSGASAPVAVISAPSSSNFSGPEVAMGGGGRGEKFSIGVVLPLTGKSSAYGRRALEGILLGSTIYAKAQEAGFTIHVEDTASSPATASAAVDELVRRHQVMAVIGPLGWKEALAVGQRCQELGVMNLSLTGKEGVSEQGPYLFQNALTPRTQLDNLVQFVVGTKGFRRIAVLAPDNSFGKDMTTEFWSLLEKAGGKVVGYQTYSPDEKDFQIPIKELVGLQNLKYRKLEVAKLAEYIKEQKVKTGKEPKLRLAPIVDFEAIFIPDTPKTVATIAANLAYFDVKGVTLLGTTEWNSDQLYKRGGRYVEGAIFPGGLSTGTKNPKQKEFLKLYAEAYGVAPDLLAAQAFEAMRIVSAGMASGSSDRNELVNRVLALKEFQSPLGTLSFDNTRTARRRLPIFTLEANGSIVEQ